MRMFSGGNVHPTRLFFMMEIINCLCYFAPLSFIAIFLHDVKHLGNVEIGFAMLVGIWASRGSRLLLAPFFDKIKINRLVPTLQLLGAIGYLLILDNHTPAFLSIFLISICYGNNSLLIRVLINQVDSPDSLNKRFAFLHVATNVAAMLGPLIFNILALYSNTILALEITSFTLVLSAIYFYLSLSTTVISKQENYFKNMRKLLTNKVLLKVYFLIIIAYFFYAQIFSLAPILLGHTYGLKAYVWVVGFLNSFISVIFSLKINEFFRRRMSIHSQIVSGFIFSILGFSSLLTIQNWMGVSMGVIFISLAEIAFIPGFQVILSNTTREDQKVAIFAINALCMGIGEGFGQYYGVLTSLGAINVYMIVIIYCMLSVGIYLSLSLERNCFFPSMVAK